MMASRWLSRPRLVGHCCQAVVNKNWGNVGMRTKMLYQRQNYSNSERPIPQRSVDDTIEVGSGSNSARLAREKALGAEQQLSQSELKPMWDQITGGTTSELSWLDFSARHIGPRQGDADEMLKALGPGAETVDKFVEQVVPSHLRKTSVRLDSKDDDAMSEAAVKDRFQQFTSAADATTVWLNGGGYYQVETPAVIRRNLFENPAWYTSYTPYQAEVSQGRLESLLNFQTMVSDLTALPVANASLLDAGTAGAEAMAMSVNCVVASNRSGAKHYLVDTGVEDHIYQVMRARAPGLGVTLVREDLSTGKGASKIASLGNTLVGVMVQYPDWRGSVDDYSKVAAAAHDQGALLTCVTDLLALTVLKPPGEFGADIAIGNSQRFGVPLGNGGPHAAFFATKDKYKRRMPGRIVGVTKDRSGKRALRLALQTREQHIRREKATSNVCTSQALLANMAAMYAIYHGPKQLKAMALAGIRWARMIQQALGQTLKIGTASRSPNPQDLVISDTFSFSLPDKQSLALHNGLFANKIGVRRSEEDGTITMAFPTQGDPKAFVEIVHQLNLLSNPDASPKMSVTMAKDIWMAALEEPLDAILESIPAEFRRQSDYLTNPVFNTHHSETEMMRYMHHLQSKDLSLVHSMIPLGSCTMKLNSAAQMELVASPMAQVHPLAPAKAVDGYRRLADDLGEHLGRMTDLPAVLMAPNSGAQGEFAGLLTIRNHFRSVNGNNKDTKERDICLIPVSAHGTNPASAHMAGLRVVPLKCEVTTGNLDLTDLEEKLKKHAGQVAAIMVTYPSTFGVFEPSISKVCDMVHEAGGLVYMDGANMNAQIGITSPGQLGADVCHLNLHKTFCIPHGGGGPGVGPICAKEFLRPSFPGSTPENGGSPHPPITSAPMGSASILPITWSYIRTMGQRGLLRATQIALLNANYLLCRLRDHYPILYTNEHGRCAHEFIIDARPFKATAGIEAVDIAKRLQDYGFHAPTMSWPVANTLMIEPTESESRAELDRFVAAMVSIRREIRDVEEGRQPREGNVLRMAPHSQLDLIGGADGWDRPYSRQMAAYPLAYLREKKFWPSVTRVDDAYGDSNLVCSCPPVEDTDEAY